MPVSRMSRASGTAIRRSERFRGELSALLNRRLCRQQGLRERAFAQSSTWFVGDHGWRLSRRLISLPPADYGKVGPLSNAISASLSACCLCDFGYTDFAFNSSQDSHQEAL